MARYCILFNIENILPIENQLMYDTACCIQSNLMNHKNSVSLQYVFHFNRIAHAFNGTPRVVTKLLKHSKQNTHHTNSFTNTSHHTISKCISLSLSHNWHFALFASSQMFRVHSDHNVQYFNVLFHLSIWFMIANALRFVHQYPTNVEWENS